MSRLLPDDTNMDDLRAMEVMPKAVIFAIAKHLAAQTSDSYDEAIETRSYITRIREEWEALHKNGIVAQRPKGLKLEPGGLFGGRPDAQQGVSDGE